MRAYQVNHGDQTQGTDSYYVTGITKNIKRPINVKLNEMVGNINLN